MLLPRPRTSHLRPLPPYAVNLLALVVAALVAALAVVVVPDAPARAVAQVATQASTGSHARPNIVLILTDDMRADDIRWMPQTRRLLGGSGTTFTRAVSPNPLCCPARAELLTAEYTHNNGVHSNGGQWGGFHALKDRDNTLGVWLQNAGYKTAYLGKYLNTWSLPRDGVPAGWTHFDATTANVYRYTKYRFSNDGHNNLSQANIGRDAQGRGYITRAMTTIMKRWIGEFSGSDQPFFLFDSELAPHMGGISDTKAGPALPEPKYAHLYAHAVNPATRSAAYQDPNVSDVPVEARLSGKHAGPAYNQAMFLGRIRALRSVDDHVAAIVKKLRETGELANTELIFTSDNGFMNGEHRYSNKLLGYKESLDVPLIIKGPGFGHRRSAHPVTTVDLASTIVDLAGATPGRVTDGQSVVGRVAKTGARPIPIEGEVQRHIYEHAWGWQGVLWGRYTYIRYWHGGQELYDTNRSRWQEENLLHNPRYAGVLARLKSVYADLHLCVGEAECSPAAATPPGPRAQYEPRFPIMRPAARTVPARGAKAIRLAVRVGAPVTGVKAHRGHVRLVVDGVPRGAAVAVDTQGRATVSWDPPASTARRVHVVRVQYDGGSPDLLSGRSDKTVKVRVS
ncbi:sulfatase [Nocardioides sp. DS6]|uniref:Sulfatase n=1 Tax=Nocardioides eburneus TaxID=3231482 RepID=A0ABV3SSX3_9ACTN